MLLDLGNVYITQQDGALFMKHSRVYKNLSTLLPLVEGLKLSRDSNGIDFSSW